MEISVEDGRAVYDYQDTADEPVRGIVSAASRGEGGAITISMDSVKTLGMDERDRGPAKIVFSPTPHEGVWRVAMRPETHPDRTVVYLDATDRDRYPTEVEECDEW